MWPVIILATLALVAGIVGGRMEAMRIPKKRARFDNRQSLEVTEIFQRFYAGSGFEESEICGLWKHVADTLKLDPGRLRPTDRFDRELGPVAGHLVEDEISDLEQFLVEESRRLGFPVKRCHFGTLDEFIRFLAEKRARHRAESCGWKHDPGL